MRMLQYVVLLVALFVFSASGQVVVISNFEDATPGTVYTSSVEGGLSSITLKQNTTDKVEGTSSLEVKSIIGAYHEWGSYSNVGYNNTAATTQDWTISDSLSIWIKVKMQPHIPANMLMRITLDDKPTASSPTEAYIYENLVIIDSTRGWVNLRVPLKERVQPGTTIPDSTGFILAPTSWGGFTYNNRKLDRDKIFDWSINIVTSGYTAGVNIPADSVIVLFDNFTRFGARAVPITFFNGLVFTAPTIPATSPWAWGAGAGVSIEKGAGTVAKSNAVKFIESSEWGGWGGWGVDMTSSNMMGSWLKDSLQMKIKAAAGGDDTLRAQFESASGKRAIKFKATRDNVWHTYKFALRDMLFNDGSPNFDTSAVIKFGVMENGHNTTGGQIDYFTDVWTGNPVLDVIPPDSATGLSIAPSTFANVFSWNAVTSKPNVVYNSYVADHAWTNPSDTTVEDIPPYNSPALTITHLLRAPNTNQNLTYYYGVQAQDGSGNLSGTSLKGPITTMAKGVPTIAKAPPTNFAADGNISEWIAAGIKPFLISKDSGTAHVNENGVIANDADCSAKAYVAMDANNLYVAFDVTDDVVSVDTTALDYEQDAPDLFIGLYDWRGKFHSGLSSGTKPDYHLRFSQNRIQFDGINKTFTYATAGNPNYIWVQKIIGSGYIVEAKIPFTAFVSARPADKLFAPKEGMRIPIDFEINDRDNKTAADFRDGMLCYSPLNNDNSYSDMWHWSYTWIGNLMKPVVSVEQVSAVPMKYSLLQNYPNPFNPSTQINYSIEKAGQVSLKVYDMLGRVVSTVVNEHQTAGTYTVSLNMAGQGFSSGVYFYRLETGSFVSTRKLILLK